MTKTASSLIYLYLFLGSWFVLACDSDDPDRDDVVSHVESSENDQNDALIDPEQGDGNEPEVPEEEGAPSDTPMEDPEQEEELSEKEEQDDEPIEIVQNISGLGAFQVKSVDVLKASIIGCFNNQDILSISDDMLITEEVADDLGSGRERFLIPKEAVTYVAGANIVDLESENLSGEPGPVTGVRSDQLTDTYLRAVAVVADVVAHNCSANDPYCTCGSEQSATDMLSRCLPSFNPNSDAFKGLAVKFAEHCGATEKSQREAIASLISSYAFIKGR